MYIPSIFSFTDKSEIVSFMKQYSFATIVTVKDNVPTANHLPFIVDEREEKIILVSHFANANSQWLEISESSCLVIFSEPHAYVSPKHYNRQLAVPTWNYIAVHAYGVGEIITDEKKTLEILDQTIRFYDGNYLNQWNGFPADYKSKAVKGIVAFEITVHDIQAKRKLSQNKSDAERQRISESLAQSESQTERRLSDYMKEFTV